ncbi:HAD-IA family hydrolase [Oricola cellulosilytica]|uniref:phosphoglycolate phosphatase n=1 Tax=Oricola cellulosilytica TaxID=1429082 RepID=A0A4R0PAS3_9HYPH|nr:HAD-IA family hydrolase [Oricola cellulosilytica]TCD13395.1 HAD family hydrolase [Oricola cellulosilytica]
MPESSLHERRGWPQAILFDLDGTLVDSAPDIAAATNTLLHRFGLGPLPLDSIRGMIGRGVGKLVERALAASGRPLAGDALEEAVDAMMTIYGGHLTNLTTLMPGALQTVADCAAAGVKCGIVSNKPIAFTQEISDHFGFTPHLVAVQGAETHLAKKPAPDMLLAALEKTGSTVARSLMVGDSAADVGAARAASMRIVLVRGGYTPDDPATLGADAVIDTLTDLPAALEQITELA